MLGSLFTVLVGTPAASTFALPAASTSGELEARQRVNTDLIVTGWQSACASPSPMDKSKYTSGSSPEKCTASFQVGAPDAYISGFYGFSARCDNIPFNAGNYLLCQDFGSYRINPKDKGLTKISLIHTQVEPSRNRVSIALGSAEVLPSSFFTVRPTTVQIGA